MVFTPSPFLFFYIFLFCFVGNNLQVLSRCLFFFFTWYSFPLLSFCFFTFFMFSFVGNNLQVLSRCLFLLFLHGIHSLPFAFFYIFVVLRKYFESGTTSRYRPCIFFCFYFFPLLYFSFISLCFAKIFRVRNYLLLDFTFLYWILVLVTSRLPKIWNICVFFWKN